MYAVFVDGSRQYRVSEGDLVKVDFRDVAEGASVEFPRVLLYKNGDALQVGQPALAGARVMGEVVDHPTVKHYVQHFRRRKNYRRLRGHRQPFTLVRVEHILLAGQEPPPPAPAASETPPASTPAAPPA